MKRINILLLSLFLSLVSATTVSVSIVEYRFIPDTAQAVQGDTIVWTNNGAFLHTSTSGINGVWDSIWDSGTLTPGQSYARAFVDVGNFPYFCRFHYLTGMRGMVIVSPSGINENRLITADFLNDIIIQPNPFRSATKITYELNAPDFITLKILNVFGQLIKTIKIQEAKSGWNTVVWDGNDDKNQKVAKGVYFCRFGSNNKEIMKKLLKLQ